VGDRDAVVGADIEDQPGGFVPFALGGVRAYASCSQRPTETISRARHIRYTCDVRMTWKERIQQLVRRVGVNVTRYPPHTGWRRQLLPEWLGVDILFDVGANVGQYAVEIRRWDTRARSSPSSLCGDSLP
jgi:hypothetical protein